MTPSISVTNPQRIRIDIRQTKNRAREATPARKAEVAAWCVGKKCSCGCGRDATTPHHPSDTLYADEIWADLRESEPWYYKCHSMYHRGFERCPRCGGWMHHGKEYCYKHDSWKRCKPRGRHPCRFHSGPQKCRKKIACPYPPRKAEECNMFEQKEMKPI